MPKTSPDFSEPRLLELERRLEELESLEPIRAARAAAEAHRLMIAASEREEEIKAARIAQDLEQLRAHLERDPLVRCTVSGDAGSFFAAELYFAHESSTNRSLTFSRETGGRAERGRLRLAAPGTTIAVNSWPTAWTGRASDWRQVVLASGGVIDSALKRGEIKLVEVPVDTVLADPQLRRRWWDSRPAGEPL